MRALLLAALPLAVFCQDPDKAREEFRRQWADALRKAAAKHYAVGEWAEAQGQLEWARFQFARASELNPQLDAAAAKLKSRDTAAWINAVGPFKLAAGDSVSAKDVKFKHTDDPKDWRDAFEIRCWIDNRNDFEVIVAWKVNHKPTGTEVGQTRTRMASKNATDFGNCFFASKSFWIDGGPRRNPIYDLLDSSKPGDLDVKVLAVERRNPEYAKLFEAYERRGLGKGGEFKEATDALLKLAGGCEKKGLKDEAVLCYRKALELDRTCDAARQALGQVRLKFDRRQRWERWVAPREKELIDRYRDLSKFPKGEPAGREERKIGPQKYQCKLRRGKHVLLAYADPGKYANEEKEATLMQCAESSALAIAEIFGFKIEEFYDKGKDYLTIEEIQTEHEGWNPVCTNVTGGLRGCIIPDIFRRVALGDFVYAERFWMFVGSVLFFDQFLGDDQGPLSGFGQGAATETGGTWSDDNYEWHDALTKAVRLGQDISIHKVVKAGHRDLPEMSALKAWSLVDFLIQTAHDKFVRFHRYEAELEAKKERDLTGEKGLKEAFGWTAEDLDARWREWVLYNY